MMRELNQLIRARVHSEQRGNGSALAPAPPLNPTFTYDPTLAYYAVLEEERSGVLIKHPEEIAEMNMVWRDDMATIRERLAYERDKVKYPSDIRASKKS